MNLFDLAAKITLDTHSYEAGVKAAVAMGRDATETVINFVGNVSNIGVKAAKTMGTVAAAGTAGIAALTKSAVVDYYGEAEQLIGGVETLFKDSADIVLDYANGAYKTAGLSANEYMSTVTSFSASLIKSLEGDTKAAADYADMAITDMADNANKMGTSIESIQNAYQGFAKQNYTMLDNLKLGYGGTKSEMKRLIKDAEKISGKDLSIKKYSDIIEAIHIIQEDMGITGATAAEAASTIQGSMNAASSALKNLMAGLADENADLEKLTGNVVEGVSTAAKNIVPRVKITLGAIAGLADTYSDDVANFAADMLVNLTAQAPEAIDFTGKTLKNMLYAITSRKEDFKTGAWALFEALIDGFDDATDELLPLAEDLTPLLVKGVLRFQTSMFGAGIKIIGAFLNGLIDNGGELGAYAKKLLMDLGDKLTDDKNLTEIPGKALAFIDSFLAGIAKDENLERLVPGALGMLGKLGTALTDPEHLDGIFSSAWTILEKLALGLVAEENLAEIEKYAPQIIDNISKVLSNNAAEAQKTGVRILEEIGKGMSKPENWAELNNTLAGILESLIVGVVSIGTYSQWGEETATRYIEGFKKMLRFETFGEGLFEMGSATMEEIVNGIEYWAEKIGIKKIFEVGKELTAGIFDGMAAMFRGERTGYSLEETGEKIVQGFKDFFGIKSPSRLFREEIGKNLMLGLQKGMDDEMPHLLSDIEKQMDAVTDGFESSGFDFGVQALDLGADNGYIATVEQNDAVLAQRVAQGGRSGGNNITVNITVEGGEYESETALAEEIARVLQKLFARKEFA